jgi:hypothetical protein
MADVGYFLGVLMILGFAVLGLLPKVEKSSRWVPQCRGCKKSMKQTPVPNVLPDALIRYLDQHQLTTSVVSRFECPKGIHYKLWYVPRFGFIEKAFFLREEM